MIIDSHAHLDYPQLAADLPAVLARAGEAGVVSVISIGVKLTTADQPRRIAEAHDNVWFSVGVHPHEAGNEEDACNVDAFIKAADHPKCVAIGEAGLDYHYDYAPRDRQAESFRAQITAARELDLPVIVHAREADADIANIIEDEMGKGAFSGVLPFSLFAYRLLVPSCTATAFPSFTTYHSTLLLLMAPIMPGS